MEEIKTSLCEDESTKNRWHHFRFMEQLIVLIRSEAPVSDFKRAPEYWPERV